MEKIWLKSYPKGVPHTIDPSSYSSVVQLFEESCAKYKDRAAFSNMGSELSFEDLNYMTADFASFLQNVAGLKKGDRISIQLPNILQYPVALYGALRAGLIVVNTNPLYTAREMKHQLKDAGVKAVIIFANSAHLLESVIKETQVETVVVTQIGDLLGFPKSLLVNSVIKYVKKMVPSYNLPKAYSFYQAMDLGAEKPFTPVTSKPEDTAFLQYTGGTTGVAKGAELTHSNIIANMLQISAWKKPLLVEGEELAVLALPLYHIFSLTVNALALLKYGATNVMITNPRDIPGFIKILRKHKFTVFPGLNTLFNALMNNEEFSKIDFSQLKISVAGGMALQGAVAKKWNEKTKAPIVEGYGLTETSPVASCNPIDGTDKVGTIGIPLPSTEMAIWDENNKELGIGEEGEIVIKGPQVMKGYWNNKEETDKVITNGWFKSGDIGFCDEQGFFKIVDRKKDMILVSGFNVYPNEIEAVVMEHPKVLEVAAVGVEDEKSTEIVKVFIVRKDKSLTEQEVINHCKSQLTAYKVPKQVEFRDELPKTNVGKILRRELRDEKRKKSQ
jgi:long-chain acyl-CoA synthetase